MSARPQLAAVLVPALPAVPDLALEAAVRAANARLPDYARIAVWLRADVPFSAGNGLATANGRARRDAVWDRYGARTRIPLPRQDRSAGRCRTLRC